MSSSHEIQEWQMTDYILMTFTTLKIMNELLKNDKLTWQITNWHEKGQIFMKNDKLTNEMDIGMKNDKLSSLIVLIVMRTV